jgi:hypothetical protein
MPSVTPGRTYPLIIQCFCEAANARETCCAQRVHDACEVESALGSIGLDLRYRVNVANLLAPERPSTVRIAQLDAPGLCGRESGSGVLRNRAPYGLRNGCNDVDGESICIRHIRSDEVYAALLQA